MDDIVHDYVRLVKGRDVEISNEQERMRKMRMAKSIVAMAAIVAATVGHAGDSAPMVIDLREDPVLDNLVISWNASWISGDTNATVVITDNGTEIRRVSGVGEFEYVLSGAGRHEFTYTTYIGDIAQAEVYTVSLYKEWKYEVRNGRAVITGTSHTEGEVVIPSEIDGYQVTGIDGVFAG